MAEANSKPADLEKIVDGLQDLVYVTDPNRKIIYANEAFAKIFKCSRSDLVGRHIPALYVRPEHRELFEDTMRERGGRVVNYFVYVQRPPGKPQDRFYLSVDSNWIDGDESKGIEGTGRDVTGLVDFLGSFFQINSKDVIIFCTPSFASLFGFLGPEEVIGKKVEEFFFEGRSFLKICGEAWNGEEVSHKFRTQSNRGGRLLEITVSPLKQIVGTEMQVVGYQGVLEDITEELNREEELSRKIKERTLELEKALADKKLILDTVVHEMDAPTVAIRGIIDLLIKNIPEGKMSIDRQLRKLRDADQLSQLMFRLQKNVSLAESEEIKGTKDNKICHLERELINRAVYFTASFLRNRGFSLEQVKVHLKGVPPYIKVNDDLFLQVFFNLLGNAVKYSKDDPDKFKIEISSDYSKAGGLKLYFSDWGIGIPQDDTERIFIKGEKGSNTKNYLGKGLGLWVAKRILEAYQCRIWVEHTHDPTTFVISIPGDLLYSQR